MNGLLKVTGIVACAAGLAGCATKEAAPPLLSVAAATESMVGPGALTESSVVTTAARVESIDQKTRMVTLRAPDGRLHTVHVGPAVQNLSKVRKGDEVVATYYESIAVQVKKPGEAQPGVERNAEVARAQPGQKPAGVAAETTTVTATVVEIDHKHHTVDLRGPDGNVTTVDVQNPAHLTKVQVGDLVELSVTQAVAIQVEKAPRR